MYVKEGTPIYTIADLSKVWVQLDAYESDLAWVRYGQDVKFRVEAFPGELFHGRVAFIDPVLDDRTRTIKVRINVDNTALRLKPEMFVSATAEAHLSPGGAVVDEQLVGKWMCPMHPEVIADGPEACTECGMDLVPVEELGFTEPGEEQLSLVIPRTAPLITGRRAVVYVRVPNTERPTFEGRVVELGPRAGDWYVVTSGLEEGEQVVVNGNFKIDSELQIRTKLSMMNPGQEPAIEPPAPAPAVAPVAAPESFRGDLGAVVAAYLELQQAFSNDGDSQAMAQFILERVQAVDMSALEGEAHMRWMGLLPGLRAAAVELAAAGDLEARRSSFAPLTERLVQALDSFGYALEGGPVGLFHCPMAQDGAGADWLQRGEQTANPYYGSMMLRCGSRTRVLAEEL
jgi:Cu(I)/Ag(I) efflux system membrane fusion protein